MLHLNLYKQFAKKENSTKRPASGTLTLGLQGILKEPCSIMTPVVQIERLSSDAMPFDYTYARWVEADRYYFVEDWTWVDGLWEVRLKEDVLATFKTQIGAETEYILRTDSTTNFNTNISDTTYPTTTDIDTETVVGVNAFTDDLTVGCYIVGIISGDSNEAVGAISYYVMTSDQFGDLKEELFSDDNLEIMGIIDHSGTTVIQDLSQEVLKTMYNPYQYIVSCMWFPFPETVIEDKTFVDHINIGWWRYPLEGYRLYAQTVTIAEQPIQFTPHPQASTRGNYLNYAPYSKRYLVGRFGTVSIDSANYKLGDSIDVSYIVDLITGHCRAQIGRLNVQNYDLFTERQFLLGVPIQIAQVGTDYLGTAVSAISGAKGVMSGAISGAPFGGLGMIAGAIIGGANGIYNTIQSAMPIVETSGSNGSFLSPSFQTHSVTQFYKIVDEDIHHRGRPLCELRQINTLSGFILCAEGDMDIDCYDNERKEIVKFLTTGFFWE